MSCSKPMLFLITAVHFATPKKVPLITRRTSGFSSSANYKYLNAQLPRGGNLFHNNQDVSVLDTQTAQIHNHNSSLILGSNITNGNNIIVKPCSIGEISVCSVQGNRQYMEDEIYTNNEGSFAAVFDGHGGGAVSKYLRQNLYARYLAKASKGDSEMIDRNDYKNQEGGITTAYKNYTIFNPLNSSTVRVCTRSLENAFEKIDNEVQKISHWSFQGSTACVIKLCQVPVYEEGSSLRSVLITANVGDSRALLSRQGIAIDLTRDHKPNDPLERSRIENLGGKVLWCGLRDKIGRPIFRTKFGGFTGVYRINGNLSLSRAIGDRSERPLVSAKVDIEQWELNSETDEFVILATDGLWDVWSSQDVVDFCRQKLQRIFERKEGIETKAVEDAKRKMARAVVKEALRRGSGDNISVIILWLSNDS